MNWFSDKSIVVPVDFSDPSLDAVETAVGMASDPSQVHVVHVLADLSPLEPSEVWGTIDNEKRTKNVLKALREKLPDQKYAGVHFHVEVGDAGAAIANKAEQLGVDLIVVPSHGRTGFSRLLIGSVAERVVRLASCPVLVLRQ